MTALITAARSYLGTPFRHAGRDRNGVDCVGLILAAARDCGLFTHDPKPYARGDYSRLVAEVERFAAPVEGPPQPGDMLLMLSHGDLTHCALCTEAGKILHAHERLGRVVEQRLGPAVLGRVASVYRWRERP